MKLTPEQEREITDSRQDPRYRSLVDACIAFIDEHEAQWLDYEGSVVAEAWHEAWWERTYQMGVEDGLEQHNKNRRARRAVQKMKSVAAGSGR